MPTTLNSILALDVGAKRVGIAVASQTARLAQPLTTLIRDDNLFPALGDVIEAEAINTLVVGLPRGLSGQHTTQTVLIENFVAELRQYFVNVPIYLQDEALTSRKAEAELQSRGKDYKRADIDALAATYILEDWLDEHHNLEKS